MIHSLVSQFVFAVLVGTCALAFFKGGESERWGAICICLTWLTEYGTAMFLKSVFSAHAEELTLLATDAALALALLALAFRFGKIWLGIAMLMQSAELALHGAVMADWGFSFRQYILFNNVINLGIILLLCGATMNVWLKKRIYRLPAVSGIAPAGPLER